MQLETLLILVNSINMRFLSCLIVLAITLLIHCNICFSSSTILDCNNGIISGNGFGVHQDNSPEDSEYLCVAFDNFNSGLHTEKFTDTYSSFSVTNDYVYAGEYSVVRKNTDSSIDGLKIIGKETNDGFYSFFKILVPVGTEVNETANIKTLQIRDPGNNHTPQLTVGIIYAGFEPDRGIFSIYGTGEGYMANEYFDTVDLRDGRWHSVEIWFKPCTDNITDDGQFTLTIDNKTCYTSNELDTYDNVLYANTYNEDWGLMTFIRGFNMPQYFDNVFFDFTKARVMIGNASTFEASTNREIQPYIVSWSDTQVVLSAWNYGSFTTGEQAYLFVIDSNGNASAGYPITIGVPTVKSSITKSGPGNTTVKATGNGGIS